MNAQGIGQDPYHFWLHEKWLRHDTWTNVEGILLLAGINPSYTQFSGTPDHNGWPRGFQRVSLLDGRDFEQPDERTMAQWTAQETDTDDALTGILVGYESLRELWQSGSHRSREEPEYFVSWALAKGVPIKWLADARANGRFLEPSASATTEVPASKPSLPNEVEPSDRQTLLRIVAGLLEIMLEPSPLGRPRAGFENQKAIAEGLIARTEGIRGLGPTTLDQRFAEANRSLNEARRATRGEK